jgi:hypothetical protein
MTMKNKDVEVLIICKHCEAAHVYNPALWEEYKEKLTHCLNCGKSLKGSNKEILNEKKCLNIKCILEN